MRDEQKVVLFDLIEVQICGILIENKICEYINPPKDKSNKTFINRVSNLRVLQEYAAKVGYQELSDNQIEAIRKLYPVGSDRKGTTGVIKNKMIRFLNNNPQYTYDDIYNVIKQYTVTQIYQGNANMLYNLDNIFYKLENREERSPIVNLIEKFTVRNTPINVNNHNEIILEE